jgi:hypothetical protein
MTSAHNLPVDFIPMPDASLHPRSIEERGMCVPFLHPPLKGTLLRVDAAGTSREAAIPSLGDRLGKYILRWDALPEVFPFPRYDQHLWKALLEEPTLSILTIKKIAQNLLLEGHAGDKLAEITAFRVRETKNKKRQISSLITQEIIRLAREKEKNEATGGARGGAAEGVRFDLDTAKLEAFIGDVAEHALEFSVYDLTLPESVSDLTSKIMEIPEQIKIIREKLRTDEYDRFLHKINKEAQVAGFFAAKNLENARFICRDVLYLMKIYLFDKSRLDEFLQRPHQSVDGWVGPIREIATLTSVSAQRDLPVIEQSLALILRTLPVLPPFVYRDFEESQVARRREKATPTMLPVGQTR